MKNFDSKLQLSGKILFFLFLLSVLTSCGTFRRAVKLVKNNKFDKAEKLLKRATKHKVYGPGARYYLARLQVNKEQKVMPWLEICNTFCELQDEVKQMPVGHRYKLDRYDAGRSDIRKSMENLQFRIRDRMSIQGSIEELIALESHSDCWEERSIDSIRNIVVNKTIDPDQQVYNNKKDKEWVGKPVLFPTEEQLQTEPGRSCLSLLQDRRWRLSYEDATSIEQGYADAVLPQNYPAFWEIRENIWSLFQMHHSYCEMDRFKREHPDNPYAGDCWYEQAKDTLCMSQLRPLLAFHRNNPHSALDIPVCLQIICLNGFAEDRELLTPREREQMEDVKDMLELWAALLRCGPAQDSSRLVNKVAYFAQKYKQHELVFKLAESSLNYFMAQNRFAMAREALETFRPLYPDTSVCNPGFFFQEDKQGWFDTVESLLDQSGDEKVVPERVSPWNSADQDEYALVSWGQTDEVFFVRRDRESGRARVMTSRLEGKNWTPPVEVPKLSIADDVIPLSMSANGRMMLLSSGGKLWRTYRPKIRRPWMEPEEMRSPETFAGKAWLSPDDSLLLMETYSGLPKATEPPLSNISMAVLQEDGEYGEEILLGTPLNSSRHSESRPIMALGGRMLFYTSDKDSGLGEEDMYSLSLKNPRDWSKMSEPVNLGLPLNTIFRDEGISCFSEYTGYAFFDRKDYCTDDRDIWRVRLAPGVFPQNAIRLAGIVLDENDKPVGGGFIEFTPNYQLNVDALPIASNGTYTYTVADSTEVVRLFPEIPGYYSENDATHFLADIKPGEIIRDTFRLTSFDHIRQNFKLVNSTFFNGRAEFDRPEKAYPELTRLAKIAVRMGAELELTGHTDGAGAEADNKQLSLDRANSVKQFLVEKCGFDPKRISVFGFGSDRPICPNDTEEGRRCNRRVEIVFKMPELTRTP